MTPLILLVVEKLVAFKIDSPTTTFCTVVVYASSQMTNKIKLWNDISWLLNTHDLPWSFIRNFNAILGAHEHMGKVIPSPNSWVYFNHWVVHLV